jgi:hypothetical protein
MVGVVQLVERQVVILNVAGSSPVTHPTGQRVYLGPLTFYFVGTPCDLIATLPSKPGLRAGRRHADERHPPHFWLRICAGRRRGETGRNGACEKWFRPVSRDPGCGVNIVDHFSNPTETVVGDPQRWPDRRRRLP